MVDYKLLGKVNHSFWHACVRQISKYIKDLSEMQHHEHTSSQNDAHHNKSHFGGVGEENSQKDKEANRRHRLQDH